MKKLLREHFKPKSLEDEEVELDGGVGRVLGEDFDAELDVSPFNWAARYGYAIQAEDFFVAGEARMTHTHSIKWDIKS